MPYRVYTKFIVNIICFDSSKQQCPFGCRFGSLIILDLKYIISFVLTCSYCYQPQPLIFKTSRISFKFLFYIAFLTII